MFSLLGIFPEFLARNDNQERIGVVVNVKIGANSHSTPSICLSDLVSASPIGSGSGSRLFMALWCHQKFSMFLIPAKRHIDGLEDAFLAMVLLLEVDDILGKFLTSGDCYFLFILFLKLILAMGSRLRYYGLPCLKCSITVSCYPQLQVLSRLQGKKKKSFFGC